MSSSSSLSCKIADLRRELEVNTAVLREVLDNLENLRSELDELEEQHQTEVGKAVQEAQKATSTHIGQQFNYHSSTSAGAAASQPPAFGPKSRFYYAVAKTAVGSVSRGWGIYRDYENFAAAVRDPTKTWTGRGKIPWGEGASGQKFAEEKQAVDWLGEELKLDPTARIPRHEA